jgi:hypothetical protein
VPRASKRMIPNLVPRASNRESQDPALRATHAVRFVPQRGGRKLGTHNLDRHGMRADTCLTASAQNRSLNHEAKDVSCFTAFRQVWHAREQRRRMRATQRAPQGECTGKTW